MAQKIDVEAINNGVSYYLGPLLNWTLVGVVQALLEEIERSRLYFFVYCCLVSCNSQFPEFTTCGCLGCDTDGQELPQRCASYNKTTNLETILRSKSPIAVTSEHAFTS